MMNKQEYLERLEKALIAAGVGDSDEIIGEYEEHFDRKTADGYGEEEIAARLAPPEEIAGQFREIKAESRKNSSGFTGTLGASVNRVLTVSWLVFVDICAWAFFIAMYAWVFALGVTTFACFVTGGFMISGLSQLTQGIRYINFPVMPYTSSLLLGLAVLAMAALAAVGTEYCRLYTNQMTKVLARWNKDVLGKNERISPPTPMYPVIKPKKRRIMRTITLVSLVVFIIMLIAGTAISIIISGSVEPWHVWGWFV